MPVDELDGVLDRDDVSATFAVDLVYQSRQCGRLPRSGGARYEDEPPRAILFAVEMA